MLKPRYIMVGGFLGAGKTTAILKLAERLKSQGLKVGLITNDQSVGLVDTAMLDSQGFPTEEITGGCFCCRFNSLVEAADKLNAQTQPDVFIAEPVGSCTDLRATVSYPLTQMYGDNYVITPLSVLVDPIRARGVLGLTSGKAFSPKVLYIYKKQLEEADIIVINKTDLLSEQELDELEAALLKEFPHVKVMRMSARQGTGIDEWLESIHSDELTLTPSMEVDYDLYADGEALLGWLNLQAEVTGNEFDGNGWLVGLARELHSRLTEADAEIAHLKMTLTPTQGTDIAITNLVRNESEPELAYQLVEQLDSGELLLNLRAEKDPEVLKEIVTTTLKAYADLTQTDISIKTVEAFRPGRPTPTHRVAVGSP